MKLKKVKRLRVEAPLQGKKRRSNQSIQKKKRVLLHICLLVGFKKKKFKDIIIDMSLLTDI